MFINFQTITESDRSGEKEAPINASGSQEDSAAFTRLLTQYQASSGNQALTTFALGEEGGDSNPPEPNLQPRISLTTAVASEEGGTCHRLHVASQAPLTDQGALLGEMRKNLDDLSMNFQKYSQYVTRNQNGLSQSLQMANPGSGNLGVEAPTQNFGKESSAWKSTSGVSRDGLDSLSLQTSGIGHENMLTNISGLITTMYTNLDAMNSSSEESDE